MKRRKLKSEDAIALVQRKYPDYIIEWCVSYKGSYVVMAHPDDGPEDEVHGGYADPFYLVNSLTGRMRRFIPVGEKDGGRAFFNSAMVQLKGIQNG